MLVPNSELSSSPAVRGSSPVSPLLGLSSRLEELRPYQARRRAVENIRLAHQEFTTSRSCRWCGKPLCARGLEKDETGELVVDLWSEEDGIDVVVFEGKAGFQQTIRCDYRFCIDCGPRRSWKHAQIVARVVDKHQDLHPDGSVIGGALTHPHERYHLLSQMLQMQREIWERMWSGRAGVKRKARWKERFGLVGYINGLDGTWGEAHGHHPHRHQIWLFERALSDEELLEFEAELFEAWCEGLNGSGWPRPLRDYCRVERLRNQAKAIDYVARVTGLEFAQGSFALAREVASPVGKTAKGKHLSYGQILLRAVGGDERFVRLMQEIERGYAGRWMITRNKYVAGLWKQAKQEVEDELEEVAKWQESNSEKVLKVPLWFYLAGYSMGVMSLLLEVSERTGAGLEVVRDSLRHLWETAEVKVSALSINHKNGPWPEVRWAPSAAVRKPLVANILFKAFEADDCEPPARLCAWVESGPAWWNWLSFGVDWPPARHKPP